MDNLNPVALAQSRGVEGAARDDFQIALERDLAGIEVQIAKQLRDGKRAIETPRFTVDR